MRTDENDFEIIARPTRDFQRSQHDVRAFPSQGTGDDEEPHARSDLRRDIGRANVRDTERYPRRMRQSDSILTFRCLEDIRRTSDHERRVPNRQELEHELSERHSSRNVRVDQNARDDLHDEWRSYEADEDAEARPRRAFQHVEISATFEDFASDGESVHDRTGQPHLRKRSGCERYARAPGLYRDVFRRNIDTDDGHMVPGSTETLREVLVQLRHATGR